MLSLRRLPTRLGRVAARPTRATEAAPTHTRLFSSARGSSGSSHSLRSGSSTPSYYYYFATSSLVGAAGLLWLTSSSFADRTIKLDSPSRPQDLFETGPSKEEVTRIISKDAYTVAVKNIDGVSRYDGVQLASNSPCEDSFIHTTIPSPRNDGKEWMAWAVLDGHAGWQTADFLEKNLVPAVLEGIGEIKPSSPGGAATIPEEDIRQAIMKAFVDLDDKICQTAEATASSNMPLQNKLKKLLPAFAGSCALLSLYDPSTGALYVACTGDSRAVLGQKRDDGTWEAIPLSVDQTGSNEDEVARISKDHPGEENIAKGGRILGLMVSRAFGDTRWKWSLEMQNDFKRRFNAPAALYPRYDVLTPPYLTAEPVVTITKIDTTKPSFLVMATDGLWDAVSNQQSVDLVAKWMTPGEAKEKPSSERSSSSFDFGAFDEGFDWKFVEERTTVQDANAAVHLVRNSLGGNHHELISGRLAVGSPFSRHLRDDVTVQVVFFNSAEGKK